MVRLFCCLFFGCCAKPPKNKDVKVRKLILEMVKKGKSISKVDKKIEKKFGKISILYSDLDFWYYRFYNKDHDVEYDRSLDPKPLELSDLPVEMKMKIAANVKFEDRPNLREVSKFFQTTVYQDIKVLEVRRLEPKTMDISSISFLGKRITLPLKKGEEELKAVLTTHGLKLETFQIMFDSEPIQTKEKLRKAAAKYKTDMESVLKSLSSTIYTRSIIIGYVELEDLLTLLPFFKPKVLEHIVFISLWDWSEDCHDTFVKLNELKQWKQVRKLDLMVENYDPIMTLHVNWFFHLKLIGMWTETDLTNGQAFKWIRELITRSPILEVFHIGTQLQIREFCELLGPDIEVKWTDQTDGIAIWTIPATLEIPERVFKIGRHPKRVEDMWINRTDCLFNGEWCREF